MGALFIMRLVTLIIFLFLFCFQEVFLKSPICNNVYGRGDFTSFNTFTVFHIANLLRTCTWMIERNKQFFNDNPCCCYHPTIFNDPKYKTICQYALGYKMVPKHQLDQLTNSGLTWKMLCCKSGNLVEELCGMVNGKTVNCCHVCGKHPGVRSGCETFFFDEHPREKAAQICELIHTNPNYCHADNVACFNKIDPLDGKWCQYWHEPSNYRGICDGTRNDCINKGRLKCDTDPNCFGITFPY